MDLVLGAFVAWVVLSLPIAVLVGAALHEEPAREHAATAAPPGVVVDRRGRVLAAAPEPGGLDVATAPTR